MNDEQLRKKIQYSLQEGYSKDEIRQVLRSQGIRHSRINQAFNQIQEGNQQTGSRGGGDREGSSNTQDERGTTKRQQKNFGGQNRGGPVNQNARDGQSQMRKNQSSVQSRDPQNRFSGAAQNQQQAKNRQGSGDSIPGLDLTDSMYRIKQNFLLKRYSVYDQNDNKVLKAKKKIISLKTKIPFKIPDGEEIFRIESERLLNISNNYNLMKKDGKNLAVIDRKRTIFNQVWRVRDPDDNSIAAKIKTANQAVMMIRILGSRVPFLGVLTSIIPHTYEIEDNNNQKIGELEGELSIRDTYDLKLQDSGNLDREAMIAAVISIDAIEGQ